MIDLAAQIDPRLLTTLVLSGVAASLLFAAKQIPRRVALLLKRQLVTTVTVDSTCEAYHLLNEWIEVQDFARSSRSLMLENIKGSERRLTTSTEDAFLEGRLSSWRVSMSPGTYLFMFRGTLFFYTKSRKELGVSKTEVLSSTLVAFSRDRNKIGNILEHCHNLLVQNAGNISVYAHNGSYWSTVDRRKPRPLSTVYLQTGQMEGITADIDWFYRSQAWYTERGVPYRRGYLFEGPPGTGKTSLIVALATHYKKNLCLLDLSSIASNKELLDAVHTSPKDSFIVLEDVDCACATHYRSDTKASEDPEKRAVGGITTAGLLNALDGITTPENRLYFLTTNHPDKLDQALIRQGRVDRREHIGKLTEAAQERMAATFYSGINNDFTGLPEAVTPSLLLKAFMAFPHSPTSAKDYLLTLTE